MLKHSTTCSQLQGKLVYNLFVSIVEQEIIIVTSSVIVIQCSFSIMLVQEILLVSVSVFLTGTL